MNTDTLSINGYYLRPTLSYKASTIFGGDDSVRQGIYDALGALDSTGASAAATSATSATPAASSAAGASATQTPLSSLGALGSISSIDSLSSPGSLGSLATLGQGAALGGVSTQSFADLLRAGVASVNSLQLESDDLSDQFAAGLTDNIHEVLIAGEKADIALQLATAIRSKVLDAYNEIMRMQL